MTTGARSEPIGRRVRKWRTIIGLTQQQLADRVGVSGAYISMLEKGDRAVTKRTLLLKLAEALSVNVTDLTGQPYMPTTSGELTAYRAASAIRHALDDDHTPEQRPLSEVERQVPELFRARMACDHAKLFTLLPSLLTETRAHTNIAADEESRRRALKALIQVCFTGSMGLHAVGYLDLSVRLAERAEQAADLLDEDAERLAAKFATAQALWATGVKQRSATVAARAVHATADESSEVLALRGMLHLHAALTTATVSKVDAMAHLGEAEELARVTNDDSWWVEFTTANIGVWRTLVAIESGDVQAAPGLARKVEVHRLRTNHRRSRLYLNAARGHHIAGDVDRAINAILMADEIAPESIRTKPVALEMVGHMARTTPGRSGLAELVRRFGVDPLVPQDAHFA
ncbi:MAG: helix-turn-helix domain-containing protein [Corynebacteriales bacterium]|nr:helix-turn-helix domain-containing protein [Mycobacteriales bacterium]